MILEEKKLIKKVIEGDINSFEKLIEDYQLYAYNISYSILGNEEDAKDATQEAIIKVYKSIKKFKNESSFSTWLYRIVVNTCKNELRKKKNKSYSIDSKIEFEEGEVEVDVVDHSLNPSQIYEKSETRKIVQSAIEELPEDNRIVLILRDIQGLTYEEISKMVVVPVGTVKSRISRGRDQLKKILLKKPDLIMENLI